VTDNPWSLAACAGSYELYEAADAGDLRAVHDCLATCRACPIIGHCLESTLAYESTHTQDHIHLIAGGLKPSARAALLGKRYRNHYQKVTTT